MFILDNLLLSGIHFWFHIIMKGFWMYRVSWKMNSINTYKDFLSSLYLVRSGHILEADRAQHRNRESKIQAYPKSSNLWSGECCEQRRPYSQEPIVWNNSDTEATKTYLSFAFQYISHEVYTAILEQREVQMPFTGENIVELIFRACLSSYFKQIQRQFFHSRGFN